MLRKSDWRVADCSLSEGRQFIEQHHYAGGGSNTATHLHGLYRNSDGALMGVAWWIPPTKSAALFNYPDDWKAVLSLSRLALSPDVPKNGASFLLMRSVRLLGARWRCLVTYADEWQGHTGHIYKVSGWEYRGMTKPERTYTRNGKMIARKAGPRTRTHAEMIALGCELVGSFRRHRYRLIR